jgi:hypothetical protein
MRAASFSTAPTTRFSIPIRQSFVPTMKLCRFFSSGNKRRSETHLF